MIGTAFRPWWKNFLNLIYPASCLICKLRLNPLSERPLCQICWNKIEFNLPAFCRTCGRPLPARKQSLALFCRECQISTYFFNTARSVCIYDGVVKKCVHLLKYKSRFSLVGPLSKLMIDFAHNFLDMNRIDLIIPVPLHSTKQRSRQFNQAQLLAEPLAQAFRKQISDKLLVKIRPKKPQIGLSRQKRFKNVRDTFKLKNALLIKDKNVLLVDDVLTTGATANECAKMLQAAGAKRIDVLALAHSKRL